MEENYKFTSELNINKNMEKHYHSGIHKQE